MVISHSEDANPNASSQTLSLYPLRNEEKARPLSFARFTCISVDVVVSSCYRNSKRNSICVRRVPSATHPGRLLTREWSRPRSWSFQENEDRRQYLFIFKKKIDVYMGEIFKGSIVTTLPRWRNSYVISLMTSLPCAFLGHIWSSVELNVTSFQLTS